MRGANPYPPGSITGKPPHTMTLNNIRSRFLKNMKKKCSHEYYLNSLKEMSPDDLQTVNIETEAILQYLRLRKLPLNQFPDLIEKRLKKIWI